MLMGISGEITPERMKGWSQAHMRNEQTVTGKETCIQTYSRKRQTHVIGKRRLIRSH